MPEMSTKFVPKHKGDPNPNPKLLKFARKVTDRIVNKMKGLTTDDPEYWGLACIFEDEMDEKTREAALDLLLDVVSSKPMHVREHRPYPLLVQWNRKKHYVESDAEFDELLDRLAYLGMLEYDYGDKYTKEGPVEGTTYRREDREYWVPLFVPGSAEYTNMNTELMDKHPELAMFFERMTFLPLEHVTAMVPPGGAGIGMHVIPVEKAISMENQTLDIEHISYWLKKYEGHIGASICSCRYGRKKLDEGCADDYHDWCIAVGDMADYCRETGRGRDISYDEAMEILRRAEDNGYVHQVTNIDGEGKIFAICNCNVKICNALRTSQLFNTPNMSRSAYVAKVEKANCVACGRCVEYCPAGAVKLGQKLCTKSGEKEYPRQVLPDATKWGSHMWNEDYRDRNRINCYPSGTAPCKTACPAHIAVQGYLKKAAEGKYREALELIKRENPFPAVCGRICNRRCEDACTRGTIDQAVAIDAVKKFIAEQDLKAEHRFVPEIVVASNLGRWKEKIAIIGGGPAAYTAAIYASRANLNPVLYGGLQVGGQLTQTTVVENFPGYPQGVDGNQMMIDMREQAERLGADLRDGVIAKADLSKAPYVITTDEGYELQADTVIIATGASAKYLGLADEEKYKGEGVSACATCDGFFYRKKTVAVVGGGDTACEEALYLAGLAKKVYLIVRKNYLRASDVMRQRVATNPAIEILFEHNAVGLYGDNGVEGVHLVKRLGEDDEQRYDLPIDGFFLAIGHKPNSDIFKKWLETDETGYIKTIDGSPRTNIPGVFAAGDVADPHYRQAITAAASGCRAAIEADRYLREK